MAGVIGAFPYHRPRTFDTRTSGGTISGGIASNLTDFPVKVLTNPTTWPDATERGHFFGAWNVGGKRCQFFDSDETTNLAYEVEYYDAASETAVYWIKVPQVNGNLNTDKILIAYGNDPNSANQDQATGVWDSSFKAVYHLGDNSWGSSPEAKDSTSNAAHATNSGSSDAAGAVRRGRSFDGTDDVITGINLLLTGDMTVMGWGANGTGTGTKTLVAKGSGNDYYQQGHLQLSGGILYFIIGNAANSGYFLLAQTAASAWGASATKYFGATLSGATGKVFINGAQSGSNTTTIGTRTTNSANVLMGARSDGVRYNGSLDELRFSDIARSADWLKLEYHDMSNDAWATWGAEVASGPVIPVFMNHRRRRIV